MEFGGASSSHESRAEQRDRKSNADHCRQTDKLEPCLTNRHHTDDNHEGPLGTMPVVGSRIVSRTDAARRGKLNSTGRHDCRKADATAGGTPCPSAVVSFSGTHNDGTT